MVCKQLTKIILCVLVCGVLEVALKGIYDFSLVEYYQYAETIHEATHKHLLHCHENRVAWGCHECHQWQGESYQCKSCNATEDPVVPTFSRSTLRGMRHRVVLDYFEANTLMRHMECYRSHHWWCTDVLYPLLMKTLEFSHFQLHPVTALTLVLACIVALFCIVFVSKQLSSLYTERTNRLHLEKARKDCDQAVHDIVAPPIVSPDPTYTGLMQADDEPPLFEAFGTGLQSRHTRGNR
jgi:hypothetical protein